jgi:glycosyltransferase involved in cell wall biosynthesis
VAGTKPETRGGVIFDLVAAQSPSYRGRGIARYSVELARAIVKRHPQIVSSIVVHPELEPPDGTDDLADWITTRPDWAAASVVHLSSAFEPEVPVRVYWPREATSHRLLMSVTLYDLIPDVFPGWYLEDPGLRRRWRCCREIVRTADAVLTPSESARADAIGLLGVPPTRVSVIGSGTAPAFRRPESRQRAFEVAKRGVEGLEEGFIVYNGAFNPRKGVDNLLEGYASLSSDLVRGHQLVIVCEAPPLTRNHYLVMAKRLGVEDRLLIPGFVPEEVLVSLYQCAELAIFPSLYEGYGLPVVESMACGVPTMAGDNSSLQEILPRDARFQPADPGAIAEAIVRGLTDKPFRQRLVALANERPPTWDAVADKAARVFEELLRRSGRHRPGWRRRPQFALVGLPAPLADAVSAYASVDRYEVPANGRPAGVDGQSAANSEGTTDSENEAHRESAAAQEASLPLSALRKLDPWRGGYDAVVGWVSANGGREAEVIEELASRWPGRVVALLDQAVFDQARGDQKSASRGGTSFSAPGATTVLVPTWPANWEEIARRVAEAAQGHSW